MRRLLSSAELAGALAPVGLAQQAGVVSAASRQTDAEATAARTCIATSPATPSKLFLNERVEHRGPLAFEVSVLLETLLKQSFDSLQRLGPG